MFRQPFQPVQIQFNGIGAESGQIFFRDKIPVIRYVCCDCGYAEDWVESPAEWVQLWQTYGDMPGAER